MVCGKILNGVTVMVSLWIAGRADAGHRLVVLLSFIVYLYITPLYIL